LRLNFDDAGSFSVDEFKECGGTMKIDSDSAFAKPSQFCTVINCMDGRVQLPVISYLKKRFGVEYVDSITEPGPNRILAEQQDENLVVSILNRLKISVNKHRSVGIAIAGHYDCAGNPTGEAHQKRQLQDAIRFIRQMYPNIEIIGLWVDKHWQVNEILQNQK
jgi:carbonic anhydrase